MIQRCMECFDLCVRVPGKVICQTCHDRLSPNQRAIALKESPFEECELQTMRDNNAIRIFLMDHPEGVPLSAFPDALQGPVLYARSKGVVRCLQGNYVLHPVQLERARRTSAIQAYLFNILGEGKTKGELYAALNAAGFSSAAITSVLKSLRRDRLIELEAYPHTSKMYRHLDVIKPAQIESVRSA